MDHGYITTRPGINRRDLLLLGAAMAFPSIAVATIPPPPPSLWYLIFIRDGVYKISGLYVVTVPADVGTCRSYTNTSVNQAVNSFFTFTGKHGFGAWQLMLNAPSFDWWEVYDKRTGRFVRLWKYDRFEVKFADKSRVKVVFNGPNATIRFQPLVGTERLPDGTRLYPRTTERTGGGGDYKGRDSGSGGVIPITPSLQNWLWGPYYKSDADMPW